MQLDVFQKILKRKMIREHSIESKSRKSVIIIDDANLDKRSAQLNEFFLSLLKYNGLYGDTKEPFIEFKKFASLISYPSLDQSNVKLLII